MLTWPRRAGTGKSSLVCALCLGLGGNTKVHPARTPALGTRQARTARRAKQPSRLALNSEVHSSTRGRTVRARL
jgi:hypothetical protein